MKIFDLTHVYLIPIFAIGLSLSGCQLPKQVNGPSAKPIVVGTGQGNPNSTPTAPVTPTSPGNSSSPSGTADPGGGNGINNRALESYAVDVTQLEAYKKVLLPLQEAMSAKDQKENTSINSDPKTGEAATNKSQGDGNQLLRSKTWYIAPIKFKPIENQVLGLSFTDDKSQQLAVQTRREIWINEDYFNKMDLKHQAELIAHEMMMVFYTMKFEPWSYLCKNLFDRSGNFSLSTCEDDDAAKLLGSGSDPEPLRPLNEDDYANIRAATAILMAGNTGGKEFSRDLARLGFDKRLFNDRTSSHKDFNAELDRELSTNEIFHLLQLAIDQGKFESKCFYMFSKESFSCALKMQTEIFKGAVTEHRKNGDMAENIKLNWSLLGGTNPQGSHISFASNVPPGRASYETSTGSRIEYSTLTNMYYLIGNGALTPPQKYFELIVLVKKSIQFQSLLVEVVGVQIKEMYVETEYLLNGKRTYCYPQASVLDEAGMPKIILLKAKGAKEQDFAALTYIQKLVSKVTDGSQCSSIRLDDPPKQ
jgi:hypothetical protein